MYVEEFLTARLVVYMITPTTSAKPPKAMRLSIMEAKGLSTSCPCKKTTAMVPKYTPASMVSHGPHVPTM